jgi:hypothetical protein
VGSVGLPLLGTARSGGVGVPTLGLLSGLVMTRITSKFAVGSIVAWRFLGEDSPFRLGSGDFLFDIELFHFSAFFSCFFLSFSAFFIDCFIDLASRLFLGGFINDVADDGISKNGSTCKKTGIKKTKV